MADHDVSPPDDPAIIGFRPTGARVDLWYASLDPRPRADQIELGLTLRSRQIWPAQPVQLLRPGAFILSPDSALNLAVRLAGAVVRLREQEARK